MNSFIKLIIILFFIFPKLIYSKDVLQAKEGITWDSENQEYLATGNVVYESSDMKIFSDYLRAKYQIEDDKEVFNEIEIKGNIEIFYKGHPVGLDKPDFILYPDKKNFGISEPIILECKFKEKIDDDARQQLKTYLKSVPLNSNPNLKNIKKGLILNFKKKENFKEGVSKKSEESISIECWEYNKKKDKINIIFNSLNNDENITK